MSGDLLLASLLLTSASVGMILLRRIAARRVEARKARLRGHLDWINPAPRPKGRRSLMRR